MGVIILQARAAIFFITCYSHSTEVESTLGGGSSDRADPQALAHVHFIKLILHFRGDLVRGLSDVKSREKD